MAEVSQGRTRLNARHERFCQYYMSDPSATRAAVAAGYGARTARAQGSRVLARADVAVRLSELQAGVAGRSCASADALMAKLESVYVRAMENHHFHAARKAVEMQARLAGVGLKQPAGAGGGSSADVDKC